MQKTVGVVMKKGAPLAEDLVEQIRVKFPQLLLVAEKIDESPYWAQAQNMTALAAEAFSNCIDLLLVLGGDGTLIHAASLLKDKMIPILGVNLGHLGFLTEIPASSLLEALKLALEDKLPYSDRLRLSVTIQQKETKQRLQHTILNDVVVSMRSLARIATFHLHYQKELITAIRGDGVIVATPTGSTAYCLAAGGPILEPHLEAIAISPICPHQLTQRPLVFNLKAPLVITLGSNHPCLVSLDGHTAIEIYPGDEVIVEKASICSRIVSWPQQSYFQTLRQKLHWGNTPVL